MAQNLAYADVMANKPASRPIAKALPHPSKKGFAAQFAVPGQVPQYVVDNDGKVRQFESDRSAEVVALRVLQAIMDSRNNNPRRAGLYNRMTGAQLAAALDESELTPTEFAEIYGVPHERILKWIAGEQDIPHSAHVLVKLLAYEENFTEAREITNQAMKLED